MTRNLALATLCVSMIWTADVYVAPGGSDSGSGPQSAPWATIAYALSHTGNNDRIFLQRGGTWRETFTISGNRQLLAYGSGDPPVISGARPITLIGTYGTAARTAASASQVLGLWVDGAFQPLARYPNNGYLWTDTGTSLNLIRGASMPARTAGRWTGAQVRWHRWHWFWETRPITSDSGGSDLSLSANATWETGLIGVPSGFYIDNSLAELDAQGEWFWGGGTLYLIPPAGANPSTMQVEVATSTAAIGVNGATISGIAFKRFQGHALAIGNPSTIDGCSFAEIEDCAIATTYNSAPTVIRNCTFTDVRNCGVQILQNPAATGTIIERNVFERIGMRRGYGGSGPWHSAGVLINVGSQVVVQLNRMTDIGASGILMGNDAGNTASRNIIVRAISTCNDGAGIYTLMGGNTITGNIILDARGDQTAGEPFLPFGNGIWPEFLNRIANNVITGNTIAGCNGNGIYLPNNTDCTVSANVCFDNLRSGLDLDIYNGDTRAQNHVIEDNVLAAISPTRRLEPRGNFASWWDPAEPTPALRFWNGGVLDFGAMRRTTFIASSAGVDVIRGDGGGDPRYTTLAAWSAAKPSWAENSGSVVRANAVLLINDTESTGSAPVPAGTWTRADGTAVGSSVSLAPYTSVVLVGSGSPPATPVYITVSGTDWRANVPPDEVITPPPPLTPGGGGGSGTGSSTGGGGGGGGCGAGGLSAGLLLALVLLRLRRQH